jgi:hypothetical protein
MINKFFIFCLIVFLIGCKTLQKKHSVITQYEKYCFHIVDSFIFYNPIKNGVTIFSPSLECSNEYCNGVCRIDSIILHSNRSGTENYDTVINPLYANKYINSVKIGGERTCTYKYLIDDSLLLIGYKNGSPYYDTIKK